MNGGESIGSWSDFSGWVKDLADGDCVFRGESKLDRQLLPKAGRVGEHLGAARKTPHKIADERAALALFKRQARPYLGHTPSTDLEWLAIAQHHGMSTRLLDW